MPEKRTDSGLIIIESSVRPDPFRQSEVHVDRFVNGQITDCGLRSLFIFPKFPGLITFRGATANDPVPTQEMAEEVIVTLPFRAKSKNIIFGSTVVEATTDLDDLLHQLATGYPPRFINLGRHSGVDWRAKIAAHGFGPIN